MEVSKKSEELLFLDLDELESLLSDENVNVIKEEIVWETVIRWIDWSPDSRQQHMKRLLKCVRTGLVDTTFFVEKITAHRYVAADESCRWVCATSSYFPVQSRKYSWLPRSAGQFFVQLFHPKLSICGRNG